MLIARLTGAFVRRLTHATVAVQAIEVSQQPVNTEGAPGGDIYIHIRIGWKAITVFGLVVFQALLAIVKERGLLF